MLQGAFHAIQPATVRRIVTVCPFDYPNAYLFVESLLAVSHKLHVPQIRRREQENNAYRSEELRDIVSDGWDILCLLSHLMYFISVYVSVQVLWVSCSFASCHLIQIRVLLCPLTSNIQYCTITTIASRVPCTLCHFTHPRAGHSPVINLLMLVHYLCLMADLLLPTIVSVHDTAWPVQSV